ncbi:hypothetical protein IJT10_07275 [bacterium]|nr:hypothetical protein [bacterium]
MAVNGVGSRNNQAAIEAQKRAEEQRRAEEARKREEERKRAEEAARKRAEEQKRIQQQKIQEQKKQVQEQQKKVQDQVKSAKESGEVFGPQKPDMAMGMLTANSVGIGNTSDFVKVQNGESQVDSKKGSTQASGEVQGPKDPNAPKNANATQDPKNSTSDDKKENVVEKGVNGFLDVQTGQSKSFGVAEGALGTADINKQVKDARRVLSTADPNSDAWKEAADFMYSNRSAIDNLEDLGDSKALNLMNRWAEKGLDFTDRFNHNSALGRAVGEATDGMNMGGLRGNSALHSNAVSRGITDTITGDNTLGEGVRGAITGDNKVGKVLGGVGFAADGLALVSDIAHHDGTALSGMNIAKDATEVLGDTAGIVGGIAGNIHTAGTSIATAADVMTTSHTVLSSAETGKIAANVLSKATEAGALANDANAVANAAKATATTAGKVANVASAAGKVLGVAGGALSIGIGVAELATADSGKDKFDGVCDIISGVAGVASILPPPAGTVALGISAGAQLVKFVGGLFMED